MTVYTAIVSGASVAIFGVIVEVLVASVAVTSQPTVVLVLVEVEHVVVVVSEPLKLVDITEHKTDSGKSVCVDAEVQDSAVLAVLVVVLLSSSSLSLSSSGLLFVSGAPGDPLPAGEGD